MTRRGWVASALLLAGCGKSGAPRGNLLPETVGAQWRRSSLGEMPLAGLPQPLTASTVKRAQAAKYEGPGKLEATLYEMSSSAAALDAVQRWRPEANTIFFYRDEFFVVVRYEPGDRQALNAFVRDLSAHLGPKK
jgi:hypothetical protein